GSSSDDSVDGAGGGGGCAGTDDWLSICASCALRSSRTCLAASSTHAPTSVASAGATARPSASAISRAVAKRAAGAGDSADITTASSAGGMEDANRLGGSLAPARTVLKSVMSSSARKSLRPVSSSQSTTPAAYTSAWRVICSPPSCSGAMYGSLPFTTPA